ncbi:MAG: hypothetical protein NVS9B14_18470 [Candidatus Acidiferrum sp.]
MHDAFRCQFVESEVETGTALLLTGRRKEALAAFQLAADTISRSLAPELQDVPAYYGAAQAFAGVGDVLRTEAESAKVSAERRKFFAVAKEKYKESLEYWKKIPNVAATSPSGYPATSPKEKEVGKVRKHVTH